MSSSNHVLDTSNHDSGYQNGVTESETVHLWNQFYRVLCDPLKRPSMGDDPILWLTELRDIVSLMNVSELPAVIHELGDNRWCQLVFLNVRKTACRSLVKTKVGKIDITNWDLIPQEADVSCRTCSKKWPCHYTNSSDYRKCRECHIQAKKCMSSLELPMVPRKRKRDSEHTDGRIPVLDQSSSLVAPRSLHINPETRSRSPVPGCTSDEQSMSSRPSPDDDHTEVGEVRTMERVMQSLTNIEDQHNNERALAWYRIWKYRLFMGHNKNITDLMELLNKVRVELASAMEQIGTVKNSAD